MVSARMQKKNVVGSVPGICLLWIRWFFSTYWFLYFVERKNFLGSRTKMQEVEPHPLEVLIQRFGMRSKHMSFFSNSQVILIHTKFDSLV